MYQPWRNHCPTDLSSGYMFASATPDDDPNEIMARHQRKNDEQKKQVGENDPLLPPT